MDTMKSIGNGQGANGLDHGYAWYVKFEVIPNSMTQLGRLNP